MGDERGAVFDEARAKECQKYYDRERDGHVYELPQMMGLSIFWSRTGEEITWALYLDRYDPVAYPFALHPVYEADTVGTIHVFASLWEAHDAALAIQKVLGGAA